MDSEKNGSILSAIIWMFLISLLLFWLPAVGPFIAGVVGGKKAGGIGSAIIAVFLPGIIFGVVLFVFASSLTGTITTEPENLSVTRLFGPILPLTFQKPVCVRLPDIRLPGSPSVSLSPIIRCCPDNHQTQRVLAQPPLGDRLET